MNQPCLFCRIINGEIPAQLIYEDEVCIAFKDINPQAPVHLLIIPRDHITSLAHTRAQNGATLGQLMLVAARVAEDSGIAASGYRTVINTGADGGQSVLHLHVHVLGGRAFGWGPG